MLRAHQVESREVQQIVSLQTQQWCSEQSDQQHQLNTYELRKIEVDEVLRTETRENEALHNDFCERVKVLAAECEQSVSENTDEMIIYVEAVERKLQGELAEKQKQLDEAQRQLAVERAQNASVEAEFKTFREKQRQVICDMQAELKEELAKSRDNFEDELEALEMELEESRENESAMKESVARLEQMLEISRIQISSTTTTVVATNNIERVVEHLNQTAAAPGCSTSPLKRVGSPDVNLHQTLQWTEDQLHKTVQERDVLRTQLRELSDAARRQAEEARAAHLVDRAKLISSASRVLRAFKEDCMAQLQLERPSRVQSVSSNLSNMCDVAIAKLRTEPSATPPCPSNDASVPPSEASDSPPQSPHQRAVSTEPSALISNLTAALAAVTRQLAEKTRQLQQLEKLRDATKIVTSTTVSHHEHTEVHSLVTSQEDHHITLATQEPTVPSLDQQQLIAELEQQLSDTKRSVDSLKKKLSEEERARTYQASLAEELRVLLTREYAASSAKCGLKDATIEQLMTAFEQLSHAADSAKYENVSLSEHLELTQAKLVEVQLEATEREHQMAAAADALRQRVALLETELHALSSKLRTAYDTVAVAEHKDTKLTQFSAWHQQGRSPHALPPNRRNSLSSLEVSSPPAPHIYVAGFQHPGTESTSQNLSDGTPSPTTAAPRRSSTVDPNGGDLELALLEKDVIISELCAQLNNLHADQRSRESPASLLCSLSASGSAVDPSEVPSHCHDASDDYELDISFVERDAVLPVAFSSVVFVSRKKLREIPKKSVLMHCGMPSNLQHCERIIFSQLTALQRLPNSLCTAWSSIAEMDFSDVHVSCIGASFLSGCSRMTSLRLPMVEAGGSIGDRFLASCISLINVDLVPLAGASCVDGHFMYGCRSLQSLDLRPMKKVQRIAKGLLTGCESITTISLGRSADTPNSELFRIAIDPLVAKRVVFTA